jgi:DNA-binding PadR family transcriptional regulator
VDILAAGISLQERHGEFHGFLLAKEISDSEPGRGLTSHGTLYKALARMSAAGLLESTWEAPEISETEGRPRRRLYRVTALGAVQLAAAEPRPASSRAPQLGLAFS